MRALFFVILGAKPYQEGLSCIKPAAAVICMCLLAGRQSNEKMQTNKPHSQAAANHAKRENHHTKEEKQKKQKAEPRYYINPNSFSVEKMDEQKEKNRSHW